MTRISLFSVVYCSLETPAKSAAPYAHQWHTKPNIFGLNLSPVVIRSQLLTRINRKQQIASTKFQMVRHAHHPEHSRRVKSNLQFSRRSQKATMAKSAIQISNKIQYQLPALLNKS